MYTIPNIYIYDHNKTNTFTEILPSYSCMQNMHIYATYVFYL